MAKGAYALPKTLGKLDASAPKRRVRKSSGSKKNPPLSNWQGIARFDAIEHEGVRAKARELAKGKTSLVEYLGPDCVIIHNNPNWKPRGKK